jgi:phospholipase A1
MPEEGSRIGLGWGFNSFEPENAADHELMRGPAPGKVARTFFGVSRLCAVLALSALPVAAIAQIGPLLADCTDIRADSERLACYDRANQRAAGSTPADGKARAAASLIDDAWGFAPGSPRYYIDTHHQNYLLIARYTNRVNSSPYESLFQTTGEQGTLDSTEAKFQISFKARLWTTDDKHWGVWAAYTQQNQWQVYNDAISRPFRETNYMPEVLLSYRPGVELAGFHWRLVNLGFNHQSNGRSDALSRSWNRLYADFGVERGAFAIIARAWHRIKESPAEDDNPDITDFYGHGSLTAVYKWRDHSFTLMGRGNVSTGKGAAQLTWMSPRILGPLRGYVQAFTGYGESLVDYNWNQTTIGIGIAINDEL